MKTTDMAATAPSAFRFDHLNLHATADAPLRLFSDVMGCKTYRSRQARAAVAVKALPTSHGRGES